MSGGYSHIVIGAGGIGSAAAYWLSRAGAARVLVLEQYGLMPSEGSSGDHSRVIRHSYHSTTYTKLTRAMFDTWAEVESESGLPVYVKTGGIDLARAGSSGHDTLATYRSALAAEGIEFEDLTIDDIRSRWPQWRVEDDTVGMWQEETGLLDIRKSVSAHTSMALAAGVEFRPYSKVTDIDLRPGSVTVHVGDERFDADNLIVAAGSWLGDLMGSLGLHFNLTLSQEQVSYFASRALAKFTPDKHPVWIYHGDQHYYGFPVYGEAATKLGRDMRGHFIDGAQRRFEGDDVEGELLLGFLRKHLPDAAGPALLHRTCVYDMPADRDFVIDQLPDHPHVTVFNGAGHAGKFASLMGRILADLATDGGTTHDISAFSLSRPAIADPNFAPTFILS